MPVIAPILRSLRSVSSVRAPGREIVMTSEIDDPTAPPPGAGTGTDTGDATGTGAIRPAVLGVVLLGGSVVGWVAALALLLEKLAVLADAAYVPSCDVDAVLSCGSVMRTAQASVFGFPNPVIGVAAFPVVAVTGVLVLARVRLPRWCWYGLQLGVTLGIGFVGWLVAQTTVVIEALCPWCMVVWAVTIPIAWLVTARNLDAGLLDFGGPGRWAGRHPGVVLAVLYALVVVVVVVSFSAYWASLLGL